MLNKNELKEIRKEFDEFEEKREMLIRASRDIIQLSKKIIYALHRNDINSAKKGVAEIMPLVKKLPRCGYDTEMWSVALQEYAEALTYFDFITKGTLPSKKELGIGSNEYLLGLCDLTGELVRKAVKSTIEKKFDEVYKIRDLISEIYTEFLEFNLRNSELRKKSDQIKYALAKLEDIIYNLELRK